MSRPNATRFYRITLHSVVMMLIMAVLVASCRKENPSTDRIDTGSGQMVPLPMQGHRGSEVDPANTANFEQVVFKEYARLAVSLPKRIADSIIKNTDPVSIQAEMTRAMHGQDSVARRRLAAKYRISIDSLESILARQKSQPQ